MSAEPQRPVVTFPSGGSLPDWSLLSTAAEFKAVDALLSAFIGSGWANLSAEEDRVRRSIICCFADTGIPPTVALLAAAENLASQVAGQIVRRLADRDVVVLDEDGEIVGAYPFTSLHTDHLVEIAGRPLAAMCGLDALGVGAMLGKQSTVCSACRHCDEPIRIELNSAGDAIECASPARVVLWSGRQYTGGCAARSLCTVQSFFCNDAHLKAWRDGRESGAGAGVRLDAAEALRAARAVFAGLLR